LIRRLILIVAYLVAADATSALDNHHLLRGIKSLSLGVVGLDRAAQSCGINQSVIRDAIMYPASSAKFQITDEQKGPTFYVRVLTIVQQVPIQCITSVEIQIYVPQKIILEYTGEPWAQDAVIELWEDNTVLVSIADLHPQQLKLAIENMTKRFVTDWNFANKP